MTAALTISDDARGLALSLPEQGMPEIIALGAGVEGAASAFYVKGA